MKILMRIMGFGILLILMSAIILNLININIVINELNNVSALAIINAQKFAIEKMTSYLEDIGDNYYLVDDDLNSLDENSNEYKELNDKYKQEFIDYFNNAVNDPTIYEIKDIKANINEGIIYVNITCSKYKFVKNKELLNKVEYKQGYQYPKTISEISYLVKEFKYYVEEESTGYEIPKSTNFNYLLKNKTWPVTIYTWTFDKDICINEYYISAYSCIDTAYGIRSAYWYPGLRLSAKKADGSWMIIAEKNQNKYTGQKELKGKSEVKSKEIKLEVTAYNPKTGYEAKVNRFVVKDSYIGKSSKVYKEVLAWHSEIEDVYKQGSRLINYDYTYHYKEILNEYLERLT